MEKRVVLAVVLMIAVIVITQILFPPAPPPQRPEGARDTAARVARDTGRDTGRAADADTAGTAAGSAAAPLGGGEGGGPPAAGEQAGPGAGEEGRLFTEPSDTLPGDSVVVVTPLYRMVLSTRGATVPQVLLKNYESYTEGEEDRPVRLLRDGDRALGWRVTDGTDTLDLRQRVFETDVDSMVLREGDSARSVTFRYPLPSRPELTYRVTYSFHPGSYVVDVEGAFEGLGDRGYTVLTSLGNGLRVNEANPQEDRDQMAYAVNQGGGEVHSRKLSDIGAGEVATAEGGPFRWVAVRDKYFVIAYVAPEGTPGFGGLVAHGRDTAYTAELSTALPVPAGDPGFGFRAYFGPQEYDRLEAVGQHLQNVNPVGWEWLRFLIRPLVSLIMTVLTWLHTTLGLAYGWVLILFGVAMRVVLFPLYQKSMRAQMAQMEVQPKIKALQDKYEDEPQKLQQEMVKLYKENDINPLAGCLPMLLPWPVLITLFFVFRNTIEFRGVPFLWMPDLSLHDPLYITPLVMGLSMFALQWIGQRGMERNTQMKVMGYAMPVVFTFLFLRFPAGLNLYYATSNLSSLPQQWYLSRERQQIQTG